MRGVTLRVHLEISKADAKTSVCWSVSLLLPVGQDVKLSATAPVPGLSVSCHDDHGLTL